SHFWFSTSVLIDWDTAIIIRVQWLVTKWPSLAHAPTPKGHPVIGKGTTTTSPMLYPPEQRFPTCGTRTPGYEKDQLGTDGWREVMTVGILENKKTKQGVREGMKVGNPCSRGSESPLTFPATSDSRTRDALPTRGADKVEKKDRSWAYGKKSA
ncbi:hypothetical protein AVEN_137159-1, partial [Araneus ventricosus]